MIPLDDFAFLNDSSYYMFLYTYYCLGILVRFISPLAFHVYKLLKFFCTLIFMYLHDKDSVIHFYSCTTLIRNNEFEFPNVRKWIGSFTHLSLNILILISVVLTLSKFDRLRERNLIERKTCI